MINDVLDLSKIDAGQLTLALDNYSMSGLVKSAVASTESLARAKGLAVQASVDEGLPLGWGDERRLTQVLLNILGNAIKFTDQGKVDVVATAVDGIFNVEVRDTGPGIAPDHHPVEHVRAQLRSLGVVTAIDLRTIEPDRTYNNVDGNFVGGTTGQVTQNVSYVFVGFLQPIDNLPMTNSSKAGQTIPVKWQLKDVAGNLISDLGTLAPNGLTSGAVTCGSAPVDVIEELAAPGSTVFRFDGTQFIYNWQTSKPWVGGCRTLQVRLSDGTSHYAQFTFK